MKKHECCKGQSKTTARGIAVGLLLAAIACGSLIACGAAGDGTVGDDQRPNAAQAQRVDGETALRGVFFGEGPVAERLSDLWRAEDVARLRAQAAQLDVDGIVQRIRTNAPEPLARFGDEVSSGDPVRVRAAVLEMADEVKRAGTSGAPTVGALAGGRLPPVCIVALCAVVIDVPFLPYVVFARQPGAVPDQPGLSQDEYIRRVADALATNRAD